MPAARERILSRCALEEQKLSISARLTEPYSTLALLVARIPMRIEEAIGVKATDLDGHVRRNSTHPKVISDLLGHKKVNFAMDVYDRSNLQDFEQALRSTVSRSQLLPSCDPKLNVP